MWDALESVVLPRLLARKRNAPLRAWCSGPGAAEDALSLLLLLTRALGPDIVARRLKIFATAVDRADVQVGGGWRSGLERVAAPLLRGFLEPGGELSMLRPALRDVLLFGRHDLLTHAPFPHLDLLFCRGGLMPLARGLVPLVLKRLNFGLEPQGWLIVSSSERHLLAHSDLFQPVLEGSAIFRKTGSCPLRALLPLAVLGSPDARGQWHADPLPAPVNEPRCGQLVLDRDGAILLADGGARELLALPQGLGASSGARLRASGVALAGLREALASGAVVDLQDVEWESEPDGPRRRVDLEIRPAGASPEQDSGAIVRVRHAIWRQVADCRVGEADASLALSLEAARAVEEELRAAVEELERDNQQLQAANQVLALSNAALAAEQRALRREAERLAAALRAPAAGERADPATVGNGAAAPAGDGAGAALPALTRREREVMALLLQGRQSKEIAYRLGISRRTVDVHRSRLMRKAGVRSIADLVRLEIASELHDRT